MTDRRCARWSAAEDAALLRLRDVQRRDWPAIAAILPGRTASSCEQRYYGKLKGARDRTPRRRGPEPSVPAVSWRKRGARLAGVAAAAAPAAVAPVPPVTVTRRGRVISTEMLREDAFLRSRIEACGDLTRGFFGDPPPGRSALDERASAAAAAVQRPSGIGVSDG